MTRRRLQVGSNSQQARHTGALQLSTQHSILRKPLWKHHKDDRKPGVVLSCNLRQLCGTLPNPDSSLRRMVHGRATASHQKARQQSHGKVTVCNVTRINTSDAAFTQKEQSASRAPCPKHIRMLPCADARPGFGMWQRWIRIRRRPR
ncbi:hypothetical protein MKX08_002690 [Trichoderma sp. CBMAI-0020]|nr:hypothetical protein MKX08_002690 [Trichoderma sp. CBMAI-0020]